MIAPPAGAVVVAADFGGFVDTLGSLGMSAEGVPVAPLPVASAPLASYALPATMSAGIVLAAAASPAVPSAPRTAGKVAPQVASEAAPQTPAVVVPLAAVVTTSIVPGEVEAEPRLPDEPVAEEETAPVGEALVESSGLLPFAAPLQPAKTAHGAIVSAAGEASAETAAPATAGAAPAESAAPAISPKLVAEVGQSPGQRSADAAPALAPPPIVIGPGQAPAPGATGSATAPEPPPRLMLGDAFGEQLGVAIARRVHGGAEEVSIRMEPADLGRIEVRLAFDEAGSLRAVVSADSSTVLDTIRRDMGDLARALGDAGVRTDAQSFRFDRGSSGSGSASADGGSSQRGWQGGGDRSGSEHHQRHEEQYRPARRNGRLDLMA